MQVQVGHFRRHSSNDPPDGTLTETLGITVLDDEDREVITVIVDPQPGGYVVQIDEGAVDHPDGGKLGEVRAPHSGTLLFRVDDRGPDDPNEGGELVELKPRRR